MADHRTSHHHGHRHAGGRNVLRTALGLTLGYAVVELAAGLVFGSLALVSDAGMIAFLKAAEPGVSEHELAAEANYALFKAGAEDTAFPIAACGGPRSGFKHSVPTGRRLEAGEIAFTDLGARYRGYCSDTARGKVVGVDPTPEQRRFLNAQIDIVHETIAMVKPGVRIGDLGSRAIEMAQELFIGKPRQLLAEADLFLRWLWIRRVHRLLVNQQRAGRVTRLGLALGRRRS